MAGANGAIKRVFMTEATYHGDLKTAGNAPTGLAAGDMLCNQTAATAGLGGQWKVWLSVAGVNAIDRINDVGPWFLTSGAKAFNNKADLAALPLVKLDTNEAGKLVSFGGDAWTGTDTGGMSKSPNCNDWTSGASATPSQLGVGGDGSNEAKWTSIAVSDCQSKYHLYCFEQ
jgi:hypothetical protein